MERIKQIKLDLSNKREETRNLCGKTPRWETSMEARPSYSSYNSPNYNS
jgi:hypothetical protein